MNTNRVNHLGIDELLAALVDEEDRPVAAGNHLAACPQCRAELEKLKSQFIGLGEMAKQYTPAMPTPIHIEKKRPPVWAGWNRVLKPALGLGFAVCLLVASFWGGHLKDAVLKTDRAQNQTHAGILLEEVDRLVENSMPVKYQELIESDSLREDDDFMHFVVPPVNGMEKSNGTPRQTRRRGDHQC